MSKRRTPHAAGLGCAVALLATGCLPAPTYRRAHPEGARRVGFDPSSSQLARWTCGTFDLVLANDPVDGKVLHEMNRDLVVKPSGKVAGGGEQYEFGIRASEGDAGVGAFSASVVVSDDLAAPVDVKASGVMSVQDAPTVRTTNYLTTTWSCPRAPAVTVYR